MSDLMQVKWYATVLRQDRFAHEVAKVAPIALHYGATEYRVHVDNDDRYKINQYTWVPDHRDWYAYWEGPEMIEFRARWLGKYQIPITYAWATEIAVGEKGKAPANGNGGNGHGDGGNGGSGGNGHATPAPQPQASA